MPAQTPKLPGESLKNRYADLCDDDDAIDCAPADVPGSQAVSECDAGAAGDEPMESADIIDGSWFPANTKSKRQRHRSESPVLSGCDSDTASTLNRKKRKDVPSYPSNKTLASNGLCSTVLIAQLPEDNDSLLGASSRKFTQDPLNLSRGLKDILDYSAVKDVRVNTRRNIVGVEFHAADSALINVLLSTTAVGRFAVKCYRPAADVGEVSWGVIGPIHEDVVLEEMLSSIKCESHTAVEVSRLPRFIDGKKELSRAVKVGFQGKTLPPTLKVGFMSYGVRPYEKPPLRCYRCQRPGHLARGCTAAVRCLVCGGPHLKDSCNAIVPTCANCSGPHVASSRTCPRNREALAIRSLMRKGSTFEAARRQVIASGNLGTAAPASLLGPLPQSQPLLSQRTVLSTPSASNPASLHQFQVEADFHQTQGSYIIPRRFPNPPVSYASVVAPLGGATPAPAASCALSSVAPSASAVSSTPLLASSSILPTGASSATGSAVYPASHSALYPTAMPTHNPTPDGDRILDRCQQLISTTMTSLFSKFSALLFEVFSLNLLEEGKRERQVLLINMIRNHFGADVSNPLLKQYKDSTPSTPSGSLPASQSAKAVRAAKAAANGAAGKKGVPVSEPGGSRSKTPAPHVATRGSTRKK